VIKVTKYEEDTNEWLNFVDEIILIFSSITSHLTKEAMTDLYRSGIDIHRILTSAYFASADTASVQASRIFSAFVALSKMSLSADIVQEAWPNLLASCQQQIDVGNHKSEIMVTSKKAYRLVYELISSLSTDILNPHYRLWMGLVIRGLTHYEEEIRRLCASSFRHLVPLAPLRQVRNPVSDDTVKEEPNMLHDYILLRSSPPSLLGSPADEYIIKALVSHSSMASDPSPAAALPLDLRTYQWAGITFLTHLRRSGLGALLADDMGVGKTIQALTALAILRIEKQYATNPFLVICPSSLVLHWKAEISKFFQSEFMRGVVITTTNQLEQWKEASYDGSTVIITSYEMIRRAYAMSKSSFHQIRWEGIILDEAHTMKNPMTATARSIYALKSLCRIALTGTPIQNHVQELWSLMNFLIPDFLGDYQSFRQKYVKPIQKSILHRQHMPATETSAMSSETSIFSQQALGVTAEGLQLLSSLHKQVLPFILRRTKSSVLRELPEKTIVDIYCPLSTIQQQLYQKFTSDMHIDKDKFEVDVVDQLSKDRQCDDVSRSAPHTFQAIKYLQLLCVHPSLVIQSKHRQYKNRLLKDLTSSGKMIQLARLLLDANVVRRSECQNLSLLEENHQSEDERDVYVDQESDSSDDEGTGSTKMRGTTNDKIKGDSSSPPMTHKCLIFAHHKASLDVIEALVMKGCFPHVPYARLDGNLPANKRFQIAQEFNQNSPAVSPTSKGLTEDVIPELPSTAYQKKAQEPHRSNQAEELRILLMTTRACGLGLNLTQADTVIFIEHNFNPFVDLQAMDRVHRIGQTNPVTVYRLLGKHSVPLM
jgi:TATA-binding protein-associated factor